MKTPTTTRARTTSAPPSASSINLALTVDERDAIDRAKGRARRLVTLASAVTDADDIDIPDDGTFAELLEVIGESLQQIDATFAAADARKATAGGAR